VTSLQDTAPLRGARRASLPERPDNAYHVAEGIKKIDFGNTPVAFRLGNRRQPGHRLTHTRKQRTPSWISALEVGAGTITVVRGNPRALASTAPPRRTTTAPSRIGIINTGMLTLWGQSFEKLHGRRISSKIRARLSMAELRSPGFARRLTAHSQPARFHSPPIHVCRIERRGIWRCSDPLLARGALAGDAVRLFRHSWDRKSASHMISHRHSKAFGTVFFTGFAADVVVPVTGLILGTAAVGLTFYRRGSRRRTWAGAHPPRGGCNVTNRRAKITFP